MVYNIIWTWKKPKQSVLRLVTEGPFFFTTIIVAMQLGYFYLFFYGLFSNKGKNYFTIADEIDITVATGSKMLDLRPIADMFKSTLRMKALLVGFSMLRMCYYILSKVVRSFVHKRLIKSMIIRNFQYFVPILAMLTVISKMYILLLGKYHIDLQSHTTAIIATFLMTIGNFDPFANAMKDEFPLRVVFVALVMIVIFGFTFSIYFSFLLKEYNTQTQQMGFFSSIFKKWTLETYVEFFIPFGSGLLKKQDKKESQRKQTKKLTKFTAGYINKTSKD